MKCWRRLQPYGLGRCFSGLSVTLPTSRPLPRQWRLLCLELKLGTFVFKRTGNLQSLFRHPTDVLVAVPTHISEDDIPFLKVRQTASPPAFGTFSQSMKLPRSALPLPIQNLPPINCLTSLLSQSRLWIEFHDHVRAHQELSCNWNSLSVWWLIDRSFSCLLRLRRRNSILGINSPSTLANQTWLHATIWNRPQ